MVATIGNSMLGAGDAFRIGGDPLQLAVLLLMLCLLVLKELANPHVHDAAERLHGAVDAIALPFAVVTLVGLAARLVGSLA